MQLQISLSASKTNSLKGASKLFASKGFKISDDDHDCVIKKGEIFYVKKFGSNHFLLDVEGEDMYQFKIDEKKYNQLLKAHALPKGRGAWNSSTSTPKAIKNRQAKVNGINISKTEEKDVTAKERNSIPYSEARAVNAAHKFGNISDVPRGRSAESHFGVTKPFNAPEIDKQAVKEIFSKHSDDESSSALYVALRDTYKVTKGPDSTIRDAIGYYAHKAGLY